MLAIFDGGGVTVRVVVHDPCCVAAAPGGAASSGFVDEACSFSAAFAFPAAAVNAFSLRDTFVSAAFTAASTTLWNA